MPRFKVPCPSCETQVLIKSEKQIGTKVECPKCKYRFKVEAPGPEGGGDADAGGKGGKKKNKKMLVGIGITVIAVAVLAGVGAMVLGGKGSDIKKNPPPKIPNTGTAGTIGTTGEPGTVEPNKGKEEKKETPALPGSSIDPTNLLPSSTTAVVRLNPSRMRESPLFYPLFDERMQQLAAANLGFNPSDVLAYYHAAIGAERAPFGVVRLKSPTPPAHVLKSMQADPAAKRVKLRDGRAFDYHLVPANPLLAAVGQTFTLKNVLGDLYKAADAPAKAPDAPDAHVLKSARRLRGRQPDAGHHRPGADRGLPPRAAEEQPPGVHGRDGHQPDVPGHQHAAEGAAERAVLQRGGRPPPVVVAEDYPADQFALDRL